MEVRVEEDGKELEEVVVRGYRSEKKGELRGWVGVV